MNCSHVYTLYFTYDTISMIGSCLFQFHVPSFPLFGKLLRCISSHLVHTVTNTTFKEWTKCAVHIVLRSLSTWCIYVTAICSIFGRVHLTNNRKEGATVRVVVAWNMRATTLWQPPEHSGYPQLLADCSVSIKTSRNWAELGAGWGMWNDGFGWVACGTTWLQSFFRDRWNGKRVDEEATILCGAFGIYGPWMPLRTRTQLTTAHIPDASSCPSNAHVHFQKHHPQSTRAKHTRFLVCTA